MKITIDLSEHSEQTRMLIAKETSIVSVLSLLARDNCHEVRVEAIKNPNTTATILSEHDEDEDLIAYEVSHPNVNSEILKKLYSAAKKRNDVEMLRKISANPKTPLEILIDIWNTNKKADIWKGVAKNPNTPANVLSELYCNAKNVCRDEDDINTLYLLLAKHHNTPVKILLELARENDSFYWIIYDAHPKLLGLG